MLILIRKLFYKFLFLLSPIFSFTVGDEDLLKLVLEIKNQNEEPLDEVKSLQAELAEVLSHINAFTEAEILKI